MVIDVVFGSIPNIKLGADLSNGRPDAYGIDNPPLGAETLAGWGIYPWLVFSVVAVRTLRRAHIGPISAGGLEIGDRPMNTPEESVLRELASPAWHETALFMDQEDGGDARLKE
ncbi:MAG: hypothetical protein ACKOAM_03210, partial [Chakrabartia sp.]